jgi:hypothetical protein
MAAMLTDPRGAEQPHRRRIRRRRGRPVSR